MEQSNIDVFKAIADPTRRKIIQLLVVSTALSLHTISDHFAMSRQAVTRHINYLKEAGLLNTEKEGRETMCYVNIIPLKEVFDWVKFYQSFWESKLDNLDKLLNKD